MEIAMIFKDLYDIILFLEQSVPETCRYIFKRAKEGNNSSINKKKEN